MSKFMKTILLKKFDECIISYYINIYQFISEIILSNLIEFELKKNI